MNHTCFLLFTRTKVFALFPLLIAVTCCMISCKSPRKKPEAKEIVTKPEDMDQKTSEIITQALQYATDNSGKIDDSIVLRQPAISRSIYEQQADKASWSRKEHWLPVGDTLFNFIRDSKFYGLFPEDYHFRQLNAIRNRIAKDSNDSKDAALWSRADVMLTDAFLQILNDVKLGRLPNDSISQRTDSVLTPEFLIGQYNDLIRTGGLTTLVQALEPVNKDYQQLRAGIRQFLDSATFKTYTTLIYPAKDTLAFRQDLLKRLNEEDSLMADSAIQNDSVRLARMITKYQKRKGLTVDGKFGKQVLNALNTNDRDKFLSIAITLDRYKLLPPVMPDKYLWVNLPGFYLELREGDSVRIASKIICGKPLTRTPVLTSAISNMVTYPQWTIPESIILKEILPGLKKDTGYLAKKGYVLIGKDGQEVNPGTVNWSKYNKGIPYKVVQGSGDENALGILKFNFNNKYAVYLHDTNQRYLFSRAARSLSHGCVRVQAWDKLAYYILSNDSITAEGAKGKYLPSDSITSWLARKEKHSVIMKNRLPLFIRYYTCDAKEGRINFYEDIYGDDRRVRERYFAGK